MACQQIIFSGTNEVIQRRQRFYQPGPGSSSSRYGSGRETREEVSSFYSTDSREGSPPKGGQNRPFGGAASSLYSYGPDVQDALSRFDYLNDYETSSRG